MGRRLQTIYEYFSDYSEQEIDNIIYSLSLDEKLVIRARYGDNLHIPKTSSIWSKEYSEKFYGILIPKMKRLLSKGTDIQREEESIKNENKDKILENSKIEIVDYTSNLLQLLKDGKNNREICEILNISSNQLYEELLKLKNKGLSYSRKYYSDGSIKYRNILTMSDLKNYKGFSQDKTIITDTNENNMKLLLWTYVKF